MKLPDYMTNEKACDVLDLLLQKRVDELMVEPVILATGSGNPRISSQQYVAYKSLLAKQRILLECKQSVHQMSTEVHPTIAILLKQALIIERDTNKRAEAKRNKLRPTPYGTVGGLIGRM
jgi:hypothetical protein